MGGKTAEMLLIIKANMGRLLLAPSTEPDNDEIIDDEIIESELCEL